MAFTDISYNEGKCPNCKKIIKRRKPIDYAVCDCYLYDPNGHQMIPYTHPLVPQTYGPIVSNRAWGDTEHPIDIVYYCPVCHYYSALRPVEVELK